MDQFPAVLMPLMHLKNMMENQFSDNVKCLHRLIMKLLLLDGDKMTKEKSTGLEEIHGEHTGVTMASFTLICTKKTLPLTPTVQLVCLLIPSQAKLLTKYPKHSSNEYNLL